MAAFCCSFVIPHDNMFIKRFSFTMDILTVEMKHVYFINTKVFFFRYGSITEIQKLHSTSSLTKHRRFAAHILMDFYCYGRQQRNVVYLPHTFTTFNVKIKMESDSF